MSEAKPCPKGGLAESVTVERLSDPARTQIAWAHRGVCRRGFGGEGGGGLSTFRAGTLQVETHGKSMGQGRRPEATGGCCRRAGTATPSTSSPEVEDLFASPPTSASAACLCVNRRPEGGAS